MGRGAGAAKAEAARPAAKREERNDTIVMRQSGMRRVAASSSHPSWHLGVSGRVYIVGPWTASRPLYLVPSRTCPCHMATKHQRP